MYSGSKCKSVLALVQKELTNCLAILNVPLKALFFTTQNGGSIQICSGGFRGGKGGANAPPFGG